MKKHVIACMMLLTVCASSYAHMQPEDVWQVEEDYQYYSQEKEAVKQDINAQDQRETPVAVSTEKNDATSSSCCSTSHFHAKPWNAHWYTGAAMHPMNFKMKMITLGMFVTFFAMVYLPRMMQLKLFA